MKGKSKYIVPLLLAGVTATAGVVTTVDQQQQTMVQAETTTKSPITDINGAELKLKSGFEDIYQLGTPITMPDVECTDGYKVVYKIYRGTRVVDTIEYAERTTDAGKFTPTYTGAYNVVVTAEKNGAVVSEIDGLTIMVEKDDAYINLPVNSDYVIPAQVPVSNELGLKVPAPTVTITNAQGEEEEKEASEATGLRVFLVTPNAEAPVQLSLHSSGKYYEITKAQLATAGTYQIRYEYRNDEHVELSRLETNFQAVNNLTTPTDLYIKLSGNVPSTGNVNTDISLPKVTVLDSKTATDGIKAHVKVIVSRIASDGSILSSAEIDDYENYTFKPTVEGNYTVSYQADLYSVYEGVDSVKYESPTTITVKDKFNPTVMPTYSYSITDGKVTAVDYDKDGELENLSAEDKVEDILVNRKMDIPSVAVRDGSNGAKITLPAIYGTDNKDSLSDITFTREIVGNNINKKVFEGNPGETVEYTFYQTGSYEIRYIATDKAGNKVRATYNIVVSDPEDVEDGSTTLNLSIGVSTISDKETLKFSAPSATDTHDDNLDVEVGYRVFYKNTAYDPNDDDSEEYLEFDESKVVLKKTNDNGKYEIKIADVIEEYKENALGEAAMLRVYSIATADSTLSAYRDTVTEKFKDIKLIDSSDDETPAIIGGAGVDASTWNPALLSLNVDRLIEDLTEQQVVNNEKVTVLKADAKIDNVNGYAYLGATAVESSGNEQLAAFDQGNGSIVLPDVTFKDSDENLRLRLIIKDRFGNNVTKDKYEVIEKVDNGDGTWTYTISNASFRLSSSGVYTVTYRAEDTAGHVTVKSFGIRVNDKQAPTIVIDDEDKFGVDVEVGEFFEVPVGTLYKDGEVVDGDVTWELSCSGGAIAETSSTGFKPLTEGTYYITYKGIDTYDNVTISADENLFYVNAVDTTNPEWNKDSSFAITPTLAWNPDSNGEMEIEIPVVEATDPIRNESLDVVYTITSPDGSDVKLLDYEVAGKEDVKYFVAKAQGVYKVKFEATDKANNKISFEEKISVGDCEAPEITWKNTTDIPTEKSLGDTWELPLSNMTLSDKVTTDADFLKKHMTITLLKPDKTTAVTNEGTPGKNYIWKFSETGTYTLRIVVEDEAGQSRTYKYEIKVNAEEAENEVVSSVVGTVLIVVSVVILAGVVIYFVVSSRKKAPVKAPKNKKKD